MNDKKPSPRETRSGARTVNIRRSVHPLLTTAGVVATQGPVSARSGWRRRIGRRDGR